MNGQKIALNLSVVIVTVHSEFAESVQAQLERAKIKYVRLEPEDACQPHKLREIHPDVALVDHGVTTQEGLPFYQLVRNVLPDCEAILVATMEQATEAARLARLWEVFDYVLTDSARDVNRVPLLIERATTRCLPSLSELRGQAKMEHRRVLESLNELRRILKSRVEGPVVELLHQYRMSRNPFAPQHDGPQNLATEAYQHSVVDLICGRIKRLETLVEMAAEDDMSSAGEASGNQILVVDDEFVSLELAKFVLEKNGFDVLVADSAATAIRHLSHSCPALILMDVHLGDANGLRLVQSLRKSSMQKDIPVIVVTADGMRETVCEAVSAEVQGYIRKPYDPSLLVEKVKNALAEANACRLTGSKSRKKSGIRVPAHP